MKELAAAAGLEDAVIVNTCAVTAEAVRKAKQEIRRLRAREPGRRDHRHRLRGADRARDLRRDARGDAGHRQPREDAGRHLGRPAAPDLIGATERVQVDDIMSVRETAGHLIDGFGRHRAYVQVQNGCDHRCTFCIIPYGRGNSRSVPAGVVVEQIKRLVDKGFNEVVLTGVDLTSWGADLPGDAAPGRSGAAHPAAGARPAAAADQLDRFDRGRRGADGGDRDRAAADAASAPVAAGRRRPDPEADEAPPPARRRDPVLRGGAPPAPRHGLRRRHHRRLPDRDRGDVRATR